ncbi:MAG: hypothetical protein AAFR04_12830 [Pseudomonadota bacterium]
MKRFFALAGLTCGLAFTTGAVAAGPVAKPTNDAAPLVHDAQITLEFGPNGDRTRRRLRQAGYSEITITKKGWSKTRAEGCKGGVKYRITIRTSGRIIGEERIGRCRAQITLADAERLLEKRGYRRINVEEQGDIPYLAIACRRGNKYRIFVNAYGDVDENRNLGPCRKALSPDAITARLRKDGYDRIRFTDRQLPRYVAEACRNNRRVQLTMNRRGRIRDERRIGACDPPITRADLAGIMDSRGFDRVSIVTGRPPRFELEACKGLDRMYVVLNRYGKATRSYRVGRCPPPLTRRQLFSKLTRAKYSRISFLPSPKDSEYLVIGCRGNKRYKTQFNAYGEVMNEDSIGGCTSPRIETVTERLVKRGFDEVKLFVEACKGRRLVRIGYNIFGEEIERKRVGRCN